MATVAQPKPSADDLNSFYGDLGTHGLAPLWEVLSELVTPEPRGRAVPVRWRFPDMAPLVERACRLVTAAQAERRVLILENPGFPGQASATSTLYAGLQAILPGEVAPAHRHSQSALRFILRGGGAFTALNGERVTMHRYDLVLTPGWVWHDHGNQSSEPMVWLDGLDIPLVRSLDASFAEHRPDRGPCPPQPGGADWQSRWSGGMRPVRPNGGSARSNPNFLYPHAAWRGALEIERSRTPPHAHDAYRVEFTDPVSGGAVLGTMSATAQLIPAGFATRPARSSESSVHVVTEGSGLMTIGDVRFELEEGDIVAVPAWRTRTLQADRDLVLFSYSDRTTHEKLGLWREELL